MRKLFESGDVRIEKVELLLQVDVPTRGCSCRTEDRLYGMVMLLLLAPHSRSSSYC